MGLSYKAAVLARENNCKSSEKAFPRFSSGDLACMPRFAGFIGSAVLVVLVCSIAAAYFSHNHHGAFKNIMVCILLAWGIYWATHPPAAKICGSPGGPPITAPRIRLRDGRHLAYKEHGVSKHKASYKFVFVHGFASCRHHAVIATELSAEFVESRGIYVVSFDKPGYGQSDPDPKGSPKSIALDIEELADHLQLGAKFYVVGLSMGGQAVWGCLKYIPHRLAGATMLAPVVNYWWKGFPAALSAMAFKKQLQQDQWALRVAHYLPWLTYWWNTQKWFPSSSAIARSPRTLSTQDKQLMAQRQSSKTNMIGLDEVTQQGEYESFHRSLMMGFGRWEFDPMELVNPFEDGGGTVHIWQGDDDLIVPVELQRYIAQKLDWIKFHEVAGAGHMFTFVNGVCEAIVKAQLLEK